MPYVRSSLQPLGGQYIHDITWSQTPLQILTTSVVSLSQTSQLKELPQNVFRSLE
jgi:hypothetical protein